MSAVREMPFNFSAPFTIEADEHAVIDADIEYKDGTARVGNIRIMFRGEVDVTAAYSDEEKMRFKEQIAAVYAEMKR